MPEHECVFCKIVAGENDARVVYQDEELTAFWDSRPAAPVHILIIPNRHLESLNDVARSDVGLLGRIVLKAQEIAAAEGIAQSGYRVFVNIGADGGQTIGHLHFHLLGGRRLGVYRG